MNKGKTLMTGAVIFMCGSMLAACGKSQGASVKQNLNWMTSAKIITMDPSKPPTPRPSSRLKIRLKGSTSWAKTASRLRYWSRRRLSAKTV